MAVIVLEQCKSVLRPNVNITAFYGVSQIFPPQTRNDIFKLFDSHCLEAALTSQKAHHGPLLAHLHWLQGIKSDDNPVREKYRQEVFKFPCSHLEMWH